MGTEGRAAGRREGPDTHENEQKRSDEGKPKRHTPKYRIYDY